MNPTDKAARQAGVIYLAFAFAPFVSKLALALLWLLIWGTTDEAPSQPIAATA